MTGRDRSRGPAFYRPGTDHRPAEDGSKRHLGRAPCAQGPCGQARVPEETIPSGATEPTTTDDRLRIERSEQFVGSGLSTINYQMILLPLRLVYSSDSKSTFDDRRRSLALGERGSDPLSVATNGGDIARTGPAFLANRVSTPDRTSRVRKRPGSTASPSFCGVVEPRVVSTGSRSSHVDAVLRRSPRVRTGRRLRETDEPRGPVRSLETPGRRSIDEGDRTGRKNGEIGIETRVATDRYDRL